MHVHYQYYQHLHSNLFLLESRVNVPQKKKQLPDSLILKYYITIKIFLWYYVPNDMPNQASGLKLHRLPNVINAYISSKTKNCYP